MVWPAIIGAASALGATILSQKGASDRADDAMSFSEHASAEAFERSYAAYKRRYQDTMRDMELAGLNPIMAASSGFNVGQPPTFQPAQAFQPPVVPYEWASGAKDLTTSALNISTVNKQSEEIKKLQEETKKTIAQTYTERAKKGLIVQQERESVKKVMKMHSEMEKMSNEIILMKAQGENVVKQTEKVIKQIKIIDMEMKKLSKVTGWYKGSYGSFLGYVESLSRALGINTGLLFGKKF